MPPSHSLLSPLGKMNTKLCPSDLDSSMSSIREMHMEWLSLGIKLPSFFTFTITPLEKRMALTVKSLCLGRKTNNESMDSVELVLNYFTEIHWVEPLPTATGHLSITVNIFMSRRTVRTFTVILHLSITAKATKAHHNCRAKIGSLRTAERQ